MVKWQLLLLNLIIFRSVSVFSVDSLERRMMMYSDMTFSEIVVRILGYCLMGTLGAMVSLNLGHWMDQNPVHSPDECQRKSFYARRIIGLFGVMTVLSIVGAWMPLVRLVPLVVLLGWLVIRAIPLKLSYYEIWGLKHLARYFGLGIYFPQYPIW